MAEITHLSISHELAERIGQHGVETFPHECCGALLGRDVEVTQGIGSRAGGTEPVREVLGLFPLVNRRDDSPRNRFAVTCGRCARCGAGGARKRMGSGGLVSFPSRPSSAAERV